MTTALGADVNASGVGMDALTHRRIIQGEWANTGIVGGLDVVGQSSLFYNVLAGNAVCSNGSADGYTRAYWPGGNTEHPVTAGDNTYPRIDTVYIRAGTTKSDNSVHVDVAQGTPSASPTAPALPVGAQELLKMTMPAGATNTASAIPGKDLTFAIRSGATAGLLAHVEENYEGPSNFNDKGKDYFSLDADFYLPTDRLLEFRFSGIACACMHTDIKKPTQDATQMACWYAGIQLDNVDIPGGGQQFQVSRAWEPCRINVRAIAPKGRRTVRLRNFRVQWGENLYFICHSDAQETYPGRTLEVWDCGAAK
jgi:hypothetical protein